MGNQVNYKAKFVNVLSLDEETQQVNEIKQILMTDFSQEDYINSFYPSDIRDVLKQSPSRISRIINYIHNFLCDANSELVVNFQYRQWKNCLRILTSIIPVLYEEQFKETMRNIFWYQKVPEPNEEQSDRDPPLIISLLKQLVRMCFIFGFTIDTMEKTDSIINNDTLLQYFKEYYHKGWNSYDLKIDLIWKGFNPQCKYPNDIAKYYENRYLVLSCILALVSQTLFQTELFYEIEERIKPNNQEQNSEQLKVEKKNQEQNNEQNDQEDREGEIEEEKQYQQQQQPQQHQHHKQKQLNNQNAEKLINSTNNQVVRFLVQTPNVALLAIQKMPFFPELFASLIGISLFPTERIKQFLRNISNVHSQNEENLMSVSLQLIELIIGGQSLVYKDGVQQGESENIEMKLATQHFSCYNCPFPQLINLPIQIQQSIICQLTSKFYSYFKSQQQFIRGYFEKQISQFESHFVLLSCLLLKNQEIVPNLMNVYLLSYFSEKKTIKKISILMLRQISTQALLNKQLCLPQEFTLSFTNAPLVIGTWGDLLIFTLCQDTMLQLPNIKPSRLSNISIIIFNVAQEIGPINQSSSFMLCKLIRLLSNYDTVLKSIQMLMNVMNLISAVSMMLYYNSENNFELLQQVLLIADSIKFINNLTITKGKLQVWWDKHVAQNPIVNQSFVKSKQFDNDVLEIRESQVRSVTQQPNSMKKQSDEIQSLQQIEQIQSERTQKISAQYVQYLKTWQQFNFESGKLSNFKSLVQLIDNLMKLVPDPKDLKSLHMALQTHDLKSLMIQQIPVKIQADKFEGIKKMTKSIWGNCLMNSGKFPYFEKSECPYFIK